MHTTLKKRILAASTVLTTNVMLSPALQAEDSFEIYGFAQLDYIQDFDRVNPDWEATLRPSRIPTTDGLYGSDGQAILSVRQSRFGVQGNTLVEGQNLYTRFEIDMYGVGEDEGQTTIRLRHAYGEWGSILAGQTNSLFMDGDMFPNVIDYWGPAGMVFLRNPQLRYTHRMEGMHIAFAIENPGDDVDAGQFNVVTANQNIQGDEKLPDVTAQWRMDNEWGHLQVAGILRDIGYENTATPDNKPDGSEPGWGLHVSTNLKFNRDKLLASVVYGEGIASYMNDGGMDLAPDNLLFTEAQAVPLLGMLLYLDHYWNDQWSSSVGYSFTEVDNTLFQTGDAFEKGEYFSANLLFTPAKPILVGIEYLWGQRTDNDGDTGEDNRIQISVKYNFSKVI